MSFDGNAGLNKKQTFNKKEKEKEKETRSITGKRRELDVRNCRRYENIFEVTRKRRTLRINH
jgi:hypothetical protein